MLLKCTIDNITNLDFEIYIDETKVIDFEHVANKIYINCTLDKGLHHLKIVRNKENNVSKLHKQKYNIVYVNKVCYELKFDINKDSFLDLTYISKKIELEKNHIHCRAFKCNRNNVKIINESLNFDELSNIVKKYGVQILRKDMGFVIAFVIIGIFVIFDLLNGFSKYGIVVQIYFVVMLSGLCLYYLIKWIIKCHKYHALIKKIKANKIDGSPDLLDWFIYDGKLGFRD
jgi:hypothetical protein